MKGEIGMNVKESIEEVLLQRLDALTGNDEDQYKSEKQQIESVISLGNLYNDMVKTDAEHLFKEQQLAAERESQEKEEKAKKKQRIIDTTSGILKGIVEIGGSVFVTVLIIALEQEKPLTLSALKNIARTPIALFRKR
jgi:uncharacterized protein YabN with tetrapyrrole methylase and pyrophosphatase domain